MAKKKKPKRFYDYSLLFCIIFLTAFGLVMIYSASSYKAQIDYGNASYFMMRQLMIGYLICQKCPSCSSCSTSASEREVLHTGHQLMILDPL